MVKVDWVANLTSIEDDVPEIDCIGALEEYMVNIFHGVLIEVAVRVSGNS